MLEDGRITAIGPHEELLTSSPTYQRLYQLQFMDMPEAQGLDPLEQDPPQLQLALTNGPAGVARNADLFDDRVCARSGAACTGPAQLHAQPQERESSLSRSAVAPALGLDALEMELRKALKDKLVRGHVDLTLSIDRSSQQTAGYNRELVAGYLAAFAAAREEYRLSGEPDLNAILRLPGALQSDNRAGDEDLAALAESVQQRDWAAARAS